MSLIYDAAALRRELHEMPELGLKEFRTSAYVAEKLQALGIETQTNVGGTTGVVGPGEPRRMMDHRPMPEDS